MILRRERGDKTARGALGDLNARGIGDMGGSGDIVSYMWLFRTMGLIEDGGTRLGSILIL